MNEYLNLFLLASIQDMGGHQYSYTYICLLRIHCLKVRLSRMKGCLVSQRLPLSCDENRWASSNSKEPCSLFVAGFGRHWGHS